MFSNKLNGKVIFYLIVVLSFFTIAKVIFFNFEPLYDDNIVIKDLGKIQSLSDLSSAYKNFLIQDFQPVRDIFLKLNLWLFAHISLWKLQYGSLIILVAVVVSFQELLKRVSAAYSFVIDHRLIWGISLAFFLLNPIFHSAIGVAINVKHSLALLFFILALGVYFKPQKTSYDVYQFLGLYLLSLMSNILMVLALVPLLIHAFRERKSSLKKSLAGIIIFIILLSAILFMNWRYYNFGVQIKGAGVYTLEIQDYLNFFFTRVELFGRQFFQIVIPIFPQMLDKKIGNICNYLGFFLLAAYLIITFVKERKSFFVFGSFYLLPLSLVNFSNSYTFAIDTYLFATSVGFYLSLIYLCRNKIQWVSFYVLIIVFCHMIISTKYLSSFQNSSTAAHYCVETEPSFSCVTFAVSHSYLSKEFDQCRQWVHLISEKEEKMFNSSPLMKGVFEPYCIMSSNTLSNEMKRDSLRKLNVVTFHSKMMMAKALWQLGDSEWANEAESAFEYPMYALGFSPNVQELTSWYIKNCPPHLKNKCEEKALNYLAK